MDTKSGFFFYLVMNTVFKMATSFPGSLKAEQDANFARFTTQALLPISPRGVLGTKMNPETFRIRLDTQIRFEYDTCGRGHF